MNTRHERAELLPCPFCGGEAHFDSDDDGWNWIECGDCRVATNHRTSAMDDCRPLLAEAWNRRAGLQSPPVALLAKKHTGMMVDYMGLIGQARSALKRGERSPALAELLHQLARHIKELGEGWYSGDTAVVDEFLQLYCVEDDARRRIEGEGK